MRELKYSDALNEALVGDHVGIHDPDFLVGGTQHLAQRRNHATHDFIAFHAVMDHPADAGMQLVGKRLEPGTPVLWLDLERCQQGRLR